MRSPTQPSIMGLSASQPPITKSIVGAQESSSTAVRSSTTSRPPQHITRLHIPLRPSHKPDRVPNSCSHCNSTPQQASPHTPHPLLRDLCPLPTATGAEASIRAVDRTEPLSSHGGESGRARQPQGELKSHMRHREQSLVRGNLEPETNHETEAMAPAAVGGSCGR